MRHARLASGVGASLALLSLVGSMPTSCDSAESDTRAEHALDAPTGPGRPGRILDFSLARASLAPPPPPDRQLRTQSVTNLQARRQEFTNRKHEQQQQQQQQRAPPSPALQRLLAQSKTTIGLAVDERVSRAAKSNGAPAERTAKCAIPFGRSGGLRDILTNAKNILTGGFARIEQRAGNILWLGSNVLAALIPVASLLGLGPSLTSSPAISGPADAPMSANLTTLGDAPANLTATQASPVAGTTRRASLLSPSSLVVQLASNANGLQSRVEHVMGWLERSIEHLPNFPRLHPQECVKRSICEAHADPTRHGALGLTLRLLFPAGQASSPEGSQDSMEYKVINKYRYAAGYGMARRVMDSNVTTSPDSSGGSSDQWARGQTAAAACKEKYEDCLVSLLDVGQNLVDFFLRPSSS